MHGQDNILDVDDALVWWMKRKQCSYFNFIDEMKWNLGQNLHNWLNEWIYFDSADCRYNRFELYQEQIRGLLAEGAPIDAIGGWFLESASIHAIFQIICESILVLFLKKCFFFFKGLQAHIGGEDLVDVVRWQFKTRLCTIWISNIARIANAVQVWLWITNPQSHDSSFACQ